MNMIFGLFVIIGILLFFTVRWVFNIEVLTQREIDVDREDEPFELTELTTSTPTPTPVYTEKKKRGRKPKKS
jgi:hypothetical protein